MSLESAARLLRDGFQRQRRAAAIEAVHLGARPCPLSSSARLVSSAARGLNTHMHFVNSTGLPAQWTMGFEPDGREMLVVVVKATYSIPPSGARGVPWLADEQQPLVEADRFSGEPGFSAPLHETDFAHRKPACDVLLLGSAHAPHGRPVERLPVALKLGSLQKQFTVVGPRVSAQVLAVARASKPEHFQRLPLSYDYAFGGTDRTREAQDRQTDAYQPNPVGRGYWRDLKHIDGQPLPFTEASDQSVVDPAGRYVPMSFSPIGRNWTPRCAYAGTYDQHWLENTAPLWPADFDARYFQAAPADQIVPYLTGGEEVVLQHLTPEGHCTFRLPRRSMPIISSASRQRRSARRCHRHGRDRARCGPFHAQLARQPATGAQRLRRAGSRGRRNVGCLAPLAALPRQGVLPWPG